MTLTKIPLCYPSVSPSHGDPVGITPQDQSLHILQPVLGGLDARVSQHKAMMWVRVVAELVSPGRYYHLIQVRPEAALSCPRHQDPFS